MGRSSVALTLLTFSGRGSALQQPAHHVRNWSFKVYCVLAGVRGSERELWQRSTPGRLLPPSLLRCRPLRPCQKMPKSERGDEGTPLASSRIFSSNPSTNSTREEKEHLPFLPFSPFPFSSFLYSRFRIGHTQAFTSHAIMGS